MGRGLLASGNFFVEFRKPLCVFHGLIKAGALIVLCEKFDIVARSEIGNGRDKLFRVCDGALSTPRRAIILSMRMYQKLAEVRGRAVGF